MNKNNNNKKVVFIGDIHGYADELKEILASYKSAKFVFLGDYIDRGPKSSEVIKLVSRQLNDGKSVALWGNHEERLENLVKNWGSNERGTGIPTFEFGTRVQLQKEFSRNELLTFLKKLKKFVELPVAGKKYFACHGGVCSKNTVRQPNDYIEGHLDEEDFGLVAKYWHEKHPDIVQVFGHRAPLKNGVLLNANVYPGVVMLDGNGYKGGELRALVVHEDGTEELVSLKCLKADQPRFKDQVPLMVPIYGSRGGCEYFVHIKGVGMRWKHPQTGQLMETNPYP